MLSLHGTLDVLRGGKRDDETAFCDAMAFLIDTL